VNVRILHVLGSLDRGGVETWLLHVLRNIDRSRYSMHLALHSPSRSALELDAEASGGHIHRLPPPSPFTWMAYKNELAKLVVECRPSTVHSHVHFFSDSSFILHNALEFPAESLMGTPI
jgi:hypothetical protein